MKNRRYDYKNFTKIHVTKHAIDRYVERLNIDKYNRKQIINSIISQVKKAKLIGIQGDEEHHMLNGYIFVIQRKKGLLDDSMIVKTIKLSNIKKRQHYLNKFDDERKDIIA